MPRKYPSTPRPPLPNNPEFLVPYDDIHWQAPPPVAIPLPPLLPLPMYPLHIHAFVHYPPQPALPPDNMYPENNLPNQEYDDLGDPNNDLDPYDPEENDGPEGAIKAEGANESQEADEEEDADETEDAVEIDFL
ncbi:hypothetical protein EMPS_04497 [Entomortierella parvispora]|uniref:Uncharacterized protein n=1 Tax=Entomortierella parvispora TaxID=205924 RepID=A0A9P3H8T3_9FUNG|nr:hypothetical protein EMPS_04497 [Entomortierella parvispora]